MSDTPWYLKSYQDQFSAKSEQRMLSKIEGVMAQQMLERNAGRDTQHVHPSDLAKNDWCPRATYYKIAGTEETNSDSFALRRMNIFAEGHYIHEKWQKWMWLTGCLAGMWQCKKCDHKWEDKSPEHCPDCGSPRLVYREVPLYNEEHKIIGHADGMWEDTKGKSLVEIKSVGLGTIRWDAPDLYSGYESGDLTLDDLWKRIKRPLLPHRRQINLYMYMSGVHDAIVLYEWKPTQEVKEFHLAYDESLVAPLLEGAKSVNEAVEEGVVPPRPVGFTKSGACKFCPFKTKCWEK